MRKLVEAVLAWCFPRVIKIGCFDLFIKGIDFQKAFVEALVTLATKQKLNASDLAKAAWGVDFKDPIGRWRKVRGGRQALSLSDAYEMAHALGVSLADVCGVAVALDMVGDGKSLKGAPGRPPKGKDVPLSSDSKNKIA